VSKHHWPVRTPALISHADPYCDTSEGQCDCACVLGRQTSWHTSSAGFLPGHRYILSDPFLALPFNGYARTFEESRTSALAYACLLPTSSCVVMNAPAHMLARHFDTPQTRDTIPSEWYALWGRQTVDSVLNEMARLGIMRHLDQPSHPQHATHDTLAAWLHITNRCTMKCAYCYVPRTSDVLSLETGQAAIDATYRSAQMHGYKRVKFKYAGGEPLLRFSTVAELHRHAHRVAQSSGIALDGVILSNGTLLTPALIKQIQSLSLRLMISLDGIGDVHNQQRPYTDGRGSYADVIRAVEWAMEAGLVPDISITISGRNIASVPDVVTWALERDLPFSLNFYRSHSTSQPDLQLDTQRTIDAMRAVYQRIEAQLPRRSLLSSLLDRTNLAFPHQLPCGAGNNYLAFDCHGQVFACQMQMDRPVATIDDDDPLGRILNQQTHHQTPVDQKDTCRSCQWAPWCAGGCPLHTYQATGQYDTKSPYCVIYQALLPEVLRLEGLRLLKYATVPIEQF
jgi:uncharacterized protein